MIVNPAGMNLAPQFMVDAMYQVRFENRTHGLGLFVMDSLNNPWVGLGLSYTFMRGAPRVPYENAMGGRQTLELSHFGHEVAVPISVNVAKKWLSIAVKPKYQYISLRYLDDTGKARNANAKLNAFGLDAALMLSLLGWVNLGVVGYNLTGNHQPAWTDGRQLEIVGVDVAPGTIDPNNVSRLSDYALMLGHGVSVFPLHDPKFSLNVDAIYDFTSFRNQGGHTRVGAGGSAEFVWGPVPIRAGSWWDGRGRDREDDRTYISFGLGFIKPARLGGVGVDIGAGFMRQVAGPHPETYLGVNLAILIHPDL